MKKRLLPAYPVLTETVLNKVGVQVFEFVFKSTGGIDPASNGASWPGPVCFGQGGSSWTPASNDLDVEIRFQFQNLGSLFSADGVASPGATLGVAIEWTAPESDQRGLSNIVRFDASSGTLDGVFALHFDAGQILGKIFLDVLLFVVRPDPVPAGDMVSRANKAGMCFGSMKQDTCVMDLDGNGALFPVEELGMGRDEPLWRLKYDASDAAIDSFTNRNVALVVNRDHPDYAVWKSERTMTTQLGPFVRNILASWFTLFMISIKDKEPDVFEKFGTSLAMEFEPGSIAEAANYLLETFNLRRDSVADLSCSVDKAVNRKIKRMI